MQPEIRFDSIWIRQSKMDRSHSEKGRSEKRQIPPLLGKILALDVQLTKKFVSFSLNFVPIRSLKTHCKFLEVSIIQCVTINSDKPVTVHNILCCCYCFSIRAMVSFGFRLCWQFVGWLTIQNTISCKWIFYSASYWISFLWQALRQQHAGDVQALITIIYQLTRINFHFRMRSLFVCSFLLVFIDDFDFRFSIVSFLILGPVMRRAHFSFWSFSPC